MEDKSTIGRALEELEDLDDYLDDEIDIFDDPYGEPFTDEEASLANDLFNLFQEIMDNGFTSVDEGFKNQQSLTDHYGKHCLAGDPNRHSTKRDIYYDFNDENKYRMYENALQVKMQNTKNRVPTFNDTALVLKLMRKLFEGSQCVLFTTSCGLQNTNGSTMLGLHAYANDVTENYQLGNTIDVIALDAKFKTLTLYPVDSMRVESRLNSIIRNYSSFAGAFKFNH